MIVRRFLVPVALLAVRRGSRSRPRQADEGWSIADFNVDSSSGPTPAWT